MTLPAPDSAELADAAVAWRAVYVHLPFCRRRCPYCDFAVVALDESDADMAGYTSAVVGEIAMADPWQPLDAVNLGGGTPSATPPNQLAAILEGIRERFGVASDAEVSLEANPEDVTPASIRGWVELGFDRISLGVQSFDDDVLVALGRSHTGDEGRLAVETALSAGLRSVSIDLIYGSPAESDASWERTVETAVALGTPHLSAYSLTVERGTMLSRQVAAGAPAPDPDTQADRYEHLAGAVAAAGLIRYEVSNFARPGHPCRYNLATWAQGEYEAVGLGAHGFRNGVRYCNVRRLDAYLSAIHAGRRPRAGEEVIAGRAAEVERLMLGVRRASGVAMGPSHDAVAASFDVQRMIAAGVAELLDGRLVVIDPLLTDEASRAVLALDTGQPGG